MDKRKQHEELVEELDQVRKQLGRLTELEKDLIVEIRRMEVQDPREPYIQAGVPICCECGGELTIEGCECTPLEQEEMDHAKTCVFCLRRQHHGEKSEDSTVSRREQKEIDRTATK